MKLLENVASRIAYVAVGLAVLGVVLILYWVNQPSDVLDIKNAPLPFRSIRPQPHTGGVVILDVDYCKKVKANGRVRVSFVSTTREVFLPVSIDSQPPQCQHTEVPVLLPKDLAPDRYHIHFRAMYKVSPLKEVIEEFDSAPFEVAP